MASIPDSPLKKSIRAASGAGGSEPFGSVLGTALPFPETLGRAFRIRRCALSPNPLRFDSVARLVFGRHDSAAPAEHLYQRAVKLFPPQFTVAVALACALAAPGSAQDGEGDWAAFTSMLEVNQLHVDANGNVWSATNGGALHFDVLTQEYRRFTRVNRLAGNSLLSVTEDDRGHIWFGSDRQGLSRFRPEADSFDPPFLEFRNLRINALLAVGDRLYVGTEEGISLFLIDKEEVKETYRNLGKIPRDSEVIGLGILDGSLVAGTTSGTAFADLGQPNLQDPDSWQALGGTGGLADLLNFEGTLFFAGPLGVSSFRSGDSGITFDLTAAATSLGVLEGRVVAAMEDGNILGRESEGTWERVPEKSITGVRDMSDNGEVLWLATRQGLKVVGGDPPPPSKEPAQNHFFDMELLDNGELWVASVPDDHQQSFGVYQLDDSGWSVYDRKSGMPTNNIITVEADAEGRVWVGSWGGGVAVRDQDGWGVVNHENSPLIGIGASRSFVAISDIARDKDGNMWVVNVRGGVVVVDGYPVEEGLLIPQTWLGFEPLTDTGKIRFRADGDGLKWITSRTEGLVVLDDGGTPFDGSDDLTARINSGSEPRLSSDRITDLLLAADGTVWVGTNNGLDSFRGTFSGDTGTYSIAKEDWRTYSTTDGLPTNEVSALAADAAGNVWVGTEEGLARINPSGEWEFTFTASNSGLIDNRVKSLLYDEAGDELWIGTFDGLSRLTLGASAPGEKPSEGLVIYPNPFDPLQGQLTVSGLPLGASLRIFRPSGQLVRNLPGEAGRGTISWKGVNEAGFLVGSGVYLVVAEDADGNLRRGKLAVINGSPGPR